MQLYYKEKTLSAGSSDSVTEERVDEKIETAIENLDLLTEERVDNKINTAIAKLDVSSEEVYSTEETRIGTWIDGSPLYRKVYRVTLPSANGQNQKLFNGPENMKFICNLWGMSHSTAENSASDNLNQYPLPFSFPDQAGIVALCSYANMFYVHMAVNTPSIFFGSKADIILEYTKTTDAATVSTLAAASIPVEVSTETASPVAVTASLV